MAINKNFVVKNGLEVNTALILADAVSEKVGIGSTIPDYKLDVAGGIGATDVYVGSAATVLGQFHVGSGGAVLSASGIGGSVGVGTGLPAYLVDIRSPVSTGQTALYVKGDVRVTGDLNIDDLFLDNIQTDSITVSGISTFDGTISVGGTIGIDGQYLRSTGAGVTWGTFPTLRTGLSTVATSGQTGFSTTYNVGFLDVYINGVRLTNSEFTATDGSNITLDVPCFGGEIVDILAYSTISTGAGGGGAVGGGGTVITIKDSGVTRGDVSSINFGTNLSASAVSGGEVTITATGGGGESYWSQNATGINTTSNVGIGTTTASSALTVQGDISISGIATISGDGTNAYLRYGSSNAYTNFVTTYNVSQVGGIPLISVSANTVALSANTTLNAAYWRLRTLSDGAEVNGNLTISGPTGGGLNVSGVSTLGAGVTVTGTTFTDQLSVSGVSTLGAGVTVTGTTFTDQLSVSGVSTLGIVTGATYYGDASNAAVGRWVLGANGVSDYTFTGIGFTQTTNDPTLYLKRGQRYEFVNNSGGAHPFRIQQVYSNTGGTLYNNGVANNGAATGTIAFEVPFDAPNKLYYQCGNHVGMAGTFVITPQKEPAVGIRTVVSGTTGSVGAGSSATLNIDGFKTYSLLKVGISSAAWVTLYTDSGSRTSDAGRSYLTDPDPGSGVIAEVRTTTAGSSTFLMTPGVIGWNNDVGVANTIYARVTNNEGDAAAITVDLTAVKLED